MGDTVKKRRLGVKILANFGGAISNAAITVMVSYLTFYLTDSVLLSASAVGFILMFAKFFDGFTDIVAGFLIDRTNTRWGRARPYILVNVPLWIIMVMLYNVPKMNTVLQMIYVFVLYVLVEAVCHTLTGCCSTVYMKRAFYENELSKVVAFCGTCSGLSTVVLSVILPVLITIYATKPDGWFTIALFFAIPCAVLSIINFIFVPEREDADLGVSEETQKVPFKEGVKVLFHNKYIFIYSVAFLISQMTSGAVNTYYFTYIVGDLAMLGVVSAYSAVSMIGVLVVPFLKNKFGARNLIFWCSLVSAIASLLKYVWPTNITMLGILTAVAALGIIPISALINLVAIDCMKYSLWKTGVPVEGTIAAVISVATKVGVGLGGALVGVLMGLSGYNGAAAIQSSGALTMIRFLFCGYPAVQAALICIIMSFYKLDKLLPQIDEDLKQRAIE